MSQDQSQRAAEELPRGRISDLKGGATPFTQNASSDAIEQRRENHAQTLGMIAELRNSVAFQWFFDTYVKKPFEKARMTVLSPDTEDTQKANIQYNALKEVRTGMLLTEIVARKRLDQHDSAITKLREELANL